MTAERTPLQDLGGSGGCPVDLRERWRAATIAHGWPFPSDWGLPAVDAVCAAAVEGRDPVPALSWLGRARAESGAGLAETLHDVAALHAVLLQPAVPIPAVADPDGVPTRMIRAIALGWADIIFSEFASSQIIDGTTGLTTAGYLRTRLGEIYRCAHAAGRSVTDRHVLVLVVLDLTRTSGWSRLVPMLLAAEAMRAVFDGGQTLALIRPSVAVVLCRRTEELPLHTKQLRQLIDERLATDPAAATAGPARIWLERLPANYLQACELLAHLGR